MSHAFWELWELWELTFVSDCIDNRGCRLASGSGVVACLDGPASGNNGCGGGFRYWAWVNQAERDTSFPPWHRFWQEHQRFAGRDIVPHSMPDQYISLPAMEILDFRSWKDARWRRVSEHCQRMRPKFPSQPSCFVRLVLQHYSGICYGQLSDIHSNSSEADLTWLGVPSSNHHLDLIRPKLRGVFTGVDGRSVGRQNIFRCPWSKGHESAAACSASLPCDLCLSLVYHQPPASSPASPLREVVKHDKRRLYEPAPWGVSEGTNLQHEANKGKHFASLPGPARRSYCYYVWE